MTPYRDAKGRRVWWLFGQVERDGEAPRVTLPATRGWSGSAFSMWDGWRVRQPRKVDGIVTWIPGYVDAETGTFLALPDAAFPLPARARFWRGYQTVLVDENLAIAQGSYDADEKTVEWGPFLVDSRGGAPRLIPGVTDMDGLAGLSRGTLLRLAPGPAADPSPRLVLWRPAKDEVVPLKALDPTLARPSRFHLVGRVPGGRWLFEVWSSPLRVGRDGRVVSGPPGPLVNRSAVVQLDERTATLESLTPWVDEGVTDCIGLDDDGSFVGVEGMRRVVRWTDGGARRTVLFPRGE